MSPSIRRRLLLWLFPVLLLAGVAFAVPTYFNAHEEIDELFDKVLQEAAYSLLNSAAVPDAAASRQTPPPVVDDIELVSQIWGSDGRLRYRSHPFPPLPYAAEGGFSTTDWRGEPWRVFNLKTADHLIQVAQSESENRQTADEIALHLFTPLLVLLPVLAVLTWFGIGHGLRPLQDIVQAVQKRAPDSLQPIPDWDLPSEVGALVTALNGLLRRLDEALAAQRQFTADAAHELRSPLTALSLQAQVAERATEPEKRAAALTALRHGITRASHLVQQLLTLARLDPEAAQHPFVPLHLDELARTSVGDHAPLAAGKGIDLGIVTAEPAVVSGDKEFLQMLLRNLLDNAVRYTPAGGRVDVSVLADSDAIRLVVSDDGPGIPEAERPRVFDRFYRGLGNAEPGSGLGLAIVRRITDHHGAAIRLADGETGRGLKVTVCFPKETSCDPGHFRIHHAKEPQ